MIIDLCDEFNYRFCFVNCTRNSVFGLRGVFYFFIFFTFYDYTILCPQVFSKDTRKRVCGSGLDVESTFNLLHWQ